MLRYDQSSCQRVVGVNGDQAMSFGLVNSRSNHFVAWFPVTVRTAEEVLRGHPETWHKQQSEAFHKIRAATMSIANAIQGAGKNMKNETRVRTERLQIE